MRWCSNAWMSLVIIALLGVASVSDAAMSSIIYWHAVGDGLPPDVQALAAALSPTGTSGLLPTLYGGTFGDGVYRSTDNGATWVAANTGITLPMHVQGALAVDVLSPTVVYAGDYYGFGSGLYRSPDGGDAWSLVLSGASVRAVTTSPITPGLVLAGDRMAGLYRSPDFGDTWTTISVTAGLSDTHVNTLAFEPTAPHTAYVGAAESVFASGDGGLSWQFKSALPSSVYALAVSPVMPTALFAGTYTDGVYTSTNGINWMAASAGLPSGAWVTSLAFHPFTPTTVYAGTWEGQVYRSQDSGSAWTGLGYLGNVFALAVHPTAPSVIYAGTSNNGLFRGSTLHHLTIDPIPSPQVVGRPFPITLTARDELGFPLDSPSQTQLAVLAKDDPALAETLAAGGYDGTATLTDTTGTITPTVVTLSDGVAQPEVTINLTATGVVITATLSEGLVATSNPFDVGEYICLYLPLVTRTQ